MSSPGQERVIAYIDGFNLYFGLKESGFQRYFWLNVKALVLSLLKHGQTLTAVKYFTSKVTNDVEKKLRQNEYLRALSTVEGIEIIYGKFQQAKERCGICGQESIKYNEKLTDVNIATHMSADYFQDKFDAAMLISGDTDLIPPIRLINEGELNKRVFVAFPPNRVNDEVRKFSKGDFVIGRKKLADSQFASEIILNEDEKICCPGTWTHLRQS